MKGEKYWKHKGKRHDALCSCNQDATLSLEGEQREQEIIEVLFVA